MYVASCNPRLTIKMESVNSLMFFLFVLKGLISQKPYLVMETLRYKVVCNNHLENIDFALKLFNRRYFFLLVIRPMKLITING